MNGRRAVAAGLGLLAFFLFWEALPRLDLVDPVLMPTPSALPAAFMKELRSGAWLASVGMSLSHYVVGPIPGLAWVPFAIIWFGVNAEAAVFIIAIGVFWIVFFAANGAIRAVDRDLVEVAQAFGFTSAWARLTKILFPAALPGILVGVRTSLGQAWMAVVASEIFGVPGVGQRMMQASSLLSTDLVVVYMLTMAALYGLFDSGFMAAQGWLLRWKP
jgi:sulfonate transport system permease protein